MSYRTKRCGLLSNRWGIHGNPVVNVDSRDFNLVHIAQDFGKRDIQGDQGLTRERRGYFQCTVLPQRIVWEKSIKSLGQFLAEKCGFAEGRYAKKQQERGAPLLRLVRVLA